MNKASLCFPGMEKAVFKGCVLEKSIWEKRGWEPKGETRKLSSSLLLGGSVEAQNLSNAVGTGWE